MAIREMKLSAKHKRFCEEYLRDLNATGAAVRAGYSPRSANGIAGVLIQKKLILEEIQRLKAKRSEETGIDSNWLLVRLTEEAQADVADIYDQDGNLKPIAEWPKIWRTGLISSVKTSVGSEGKASVISVKMSDRVKRLELIGKHVSIQAFQDQVAHTGIDALAARLERASTRDE